MTTFDDDFIRMHFIVGVMNFPLPLVGFTWPPPNRIVITDPDSRDDGPIFREAVDSDTGVLIRVSMSQITDKQREGMTHVVRGAEYVYESTKGES